MLDLSTEQELKPLLNSRKPEGYSWLFFVIITLILLTIPNSGFVRIAGLFLAGFFLLSAIAMTIGNWMNRRTKLRMSEQGLFFENGIQKISCDWKDIQRVEVHSRRVNDKIVIVTDDARSFGIDLYNEIILNDKSGGAVGFEEGDQILKTILYQTNLDSSNKHQEEGYYYFTYK